jgi:hypothetical protein
MLSRYRTIRERNAEKEFAPYTADEIIGSFLAALPNCSV